MTRFARQRRRLVEKDRLRIHNSDKAVAFVARDSLVAAVQRKLCFAVVERRRLPALGIVAGGAVGLPFMAGELFCMDIRMACFADQWGALEHYLLLPGKRFVTRIASDGSMDSQQGEFRFRVVESGHVDP